MCNKSHKPVALITGASRGIGAAAAFALSQKGYHLALIARSENSLKTLQTNLPGESIRCIGSVSDKKFVEQAIAATLEAFRHIDLAILNAGVGSFGDIHTIDEEAYDTMMDVNVKGSFLFAQRVTAVMKKASRGQFIFIASDVSTRTFSEGAVYCASKYAQHALADALRKEVRAYGIKVGVIYPGLTATNFGDSDPGEAHKAEWLQPKDIADAIVYMSSAPAHVTIDSLMLHPMEQEW